MKQNNRKNTWKAIVAIGLVMVSLFSMSLFVNAGVTEVILGDEYISSVTSVSSSVTDDDENNDCKHTGDKISKPTGITKPCSNPACTKPLMIYLMYCKDCGDYVGDGSDFHLECN